MILPLAYAFCNVPVMPLRSEASHKAEQISQLLFGEKAEIIEADKNEWAYIQVAWDGYKGWCKQSQLALIHKKEYIKKAKYIATGHTDKLIMPEGEMWLPIGSELTGLKGGKIKPVNEAGKFKGKKLRILKAAPDC